MSHNTFVGSFFRRAGLIMSGGARVAVRVSGAEMWTDRTGPLARSPLRRRLQLRVDCNPAAARPLDNLRYDRGRSGAPVTRAAALRPE